ncbi:MAG: O-antigen ligase family protein [Phototrophicaceae bacterium]
MLCTLFLAPMWLKWTFAPKPFTSIYVLGFMITSAMIITIVCWGLSGFVGWRDLFQTEWHRVWVACLILLNIWGYISHYWAFGLSTYAGIAQTASLQFALISMFVLVVMATPTTQQSIIIVLIVSMIVHGAIGQLQVIFQSDIGLGWLGEFTLDPAQSGISILEHSGIRWLRPYGLLPHPNVLAGIIVLGLFASTTWIFSLGKQHTIGTISFIIGFWFLLLTFSRGAWIGFAVGILFALPFVFRRPQFIKKITPTVIGSIIVGVIFVTSYQPFLLSRVGVGQQNTELRSIADRVVYTQIAWDAIQNHPLEGVGIGNYAWYASNYLFYQTDYDLKGDNVHNIYLGIFAELGIIGFLLFAGLIISGIGAASQNRDLPTIALLSAFIAWAIIGLVDHYMWTLILTQTLWLSVLVSSMSGTNNQQALSPIDA